MNAVWNIIAGAAVVLSSITVVPQLVKSFRTRRTRDLSFGMLLIIISGNVFWIIHGWHINDWAICAANIILLVTSFLLLLLKIRFDRQ